MQYSIEIHACKKETPKYERVYSVMRTWRALDLFWHISRTRRARHMASRGPSPWPSLAMWAGLSRSRLASSPRHPRLTSIDFHK